MVGIFLNKLTDSILSFWRIATKKSDSFIAGDFMGFGPKGVYLGRVIGVGLSMIAMLIKSRFVLKKINATAIASDQQQLPKITNCITSFFFRDRATAQGLLQADNTHSINRGEAHEI